LLPDTPANRKKLEKVLQKIEAEIVGGTFEYASYFPNSKMLDRFAQPDAPSAAALVASSEIPMPAPALGLRGPTTTPLLEGFANQWVEEHKIEWRRSHLKSLLSTLNGRVLPALGKRTVGEITKSDILTFRAALAKEPGRGEKAGLSSKRINEIIAVLCQILDEAADRFQFTTPTTGIRRLRQRKTDVQPFTLLQVQTVIDTVRADYRHYFVVRFFTGMRTGEVHGLKWKYVDFERRVIEVRETLVLGEDDYTKNDFSQRDIAMSQPVWEALQLQRAETGQRSEYVFSNALGHPIDNKNFSERVWYPLLRYLGYEPRRPYQMRHTAATLWLAAGEAPEWIARQLGHANTEMLFRTYSRYVPNLTRQDGSAMDRLLASKFTTRQNPATSSAGDVNGRAVTGAPPCPQAVPKPRGIAGQRPPAHDPAQDPARSGGKKAQPPPTWHVQWRTPANQLAHSPH
jgi:integrase